MAAPYVQKVYQTANGEGRAPASSLSKVVNSDGDIVIVADQNSYTVNGKEFQTDGK